MSTTTVGFNRKIACKPFKERAVSTVVNKGFAEIKQSTQLVELEVVFGDLNVLDWKPTGTILSGDSVYVMGDMCRATWATAVFNVEGKDVILVPMESIYLHKSNRP